MPSALADIRILDLTRILAGPTCTQLLGDLGCDVLKIEKPGAGDDTRKWGPPYAPAKDGGDTNESAYYLAANRNKRSVAIDIATAEGQALIRSLLASSDVLVQNFKAGTLARYGLDHDSLKGQFPGLVYCSISGFGQTGPYAARAGYDFLIQGMGGLMSLTGRPDDAPGGGPMKVGVALTDILTGLYASNAILAALAHRDRNGFRAGEGQHIDLALLDVQVACLANQAMNYLATGVAPQRMGNAHPNIVPYQDFPTADGYMILAVGNDAQFARLCIEAGVPALASDPRFATNAARVAHRAALIPALNARTVTRSTAAWIAALEAVGVPCGPVNSVAEVFDDAQVSARGMRVEMAHPQAGTVAQVGCPIRLSETPVSYRRAPPLLGADTDAVLEGLLALDATQRAALRAAGVV